MKKKTVISVIVIILLIFGMVNSGLYSYWGRRHKVLYDVDAVYVSQSDSNENIYYLTYKVSVRNWWFDFTEHKYMLKDGMSGPAGGWHFVAETDYFTSENLKKNYFDIVTEFDMSTYHEDSRQPLEDAVLSGRFIAYDEAGQKDEGANLYMSDFENVKIVYE